MSDSPEKVTALQQLAQLEQELKEAEEALAQWQEYDLNRRDGSGAQDRRHEERGERMRNAVWSARQAVDARKRYVAQLP